MTMERRCSTLANENKFQQALSWLKHNLRLVVVVAVFALAVISIVFIALAGGNPLNRLRQIFSGSHYGSIPIDSHTTSGYAAFDDGLAIGTISGLFTYDMEGKETALAQNSMTVPQLRTGGDLVLACDIGGSAVCAIKAGHGEVYNEHLDGLLLDGDVLLRIHPDASENSLIRTVRKDRSCHYLSDRGQNRVKTCLEYGVTDRHKFGLCYRRDRRLACYLLAYVIENGRDLDKIHVVNACHFVIPPLFIFLVLRQNNACQGVFRGEALAAAFLLAAQDVTRLQFFLDICHFLYERSHSGRDLCGHISAGVLRFFCRILRRILPGAVALRRIFRIF